MAKLTSAERNALPSSSFAEPAQRKYPVNDPSHARNALARVSQHGSSSEKAKVRAKVHSKFPGIGKKGTGSVMEHAHAHHGKHEGDGHHASTHHGGHQTVNVHLHMAPKGKNKKFSL